MDVCVCVVRAVRCGCEWAESRVSSQPACLPASQRCNFPNAHALTHTAAPRPSERTERKVRLAGRLAGWLAHSFWCARPRLALAACAATGCWMSRAAGRREQPLSRFWIHRCPAAPSAPTTACPLASSSLPSACPLVRSSSHSTQADRRAVRIIQATRDPAPYAQQHSTGILQPPPPPPPRHVDRSLPASSLALTRILHPHVLDNIRSSGPSVPNTRA